MCCRFTAMLAHILYISLQIFGTYLLHCELPARCFFPPICWVLRKSYCKKKANVVENLSLVSDMILGLFLQGNVDLRFSSPTAKQTTVNPTKTSFNRAFKTTCICPLYKDQSDGNFRIVQNVRRNYRHH